MLIGASMVSEKLPLLIIGKSAKPHAFKGSKSLQFGESVGSGDEAEDIRAESPLPTLAEARKSLKKLQKFLTLTDKANDKQCFESLATLESVIDDHSVVLQKQVKITSYFEKL